MTPLRNGHNYQDNIHLNGLLLEARGYTAEILRAKLLETASERMVGVRLTRQLRLD